MMEGKPGVSNQETIFLIDNLLLSLEFFWRYDVYYVCISKY